jgi:hypothetical protein
MFGASKSGASGGNKDPYFSSTSLLLETAASSTRSTVVTDSGTANAGSGFTVTRNGSPSTGWVSPYQTDGYWGNYLNGSTDYLDVAASTVFNLTGSFTVECWFYLTATPANNNDGNPFACLVNYWTSVVAQTGWEFNIRTGASGIIGFSRPGGTGTVAITASYTTFALNTWYHVAVTYNGTTGAIYLNGTALTPTTNAWAWAAPSSPTLRIGRGFSTGYLHYFPGYISNLRITNGTVVYTGNFTPSTVPLAKTQSAGTNISAITGTVTSLLTCQSNRFLDNSSNNFALTVNGTPQVTGYYYPSGFTAPAASPGAALFNGSTDYLTAPNNAALALGSGDFTVECWAYVLNTSGAYFLVDSRNTGADAGFGFYFEDSSGYKFKVYRNSTQLLVSSSVVVPNTWNHCVFLRSGATSYLYLNGIQVASAADANTYVEPGVLRIGTGWNTNNYFPGYISNLRIVKGTAVYTSNFTPPTSFLQTSGLASAACYPSTTNVNTSFVAANTSLLVNFADSNYTSATDGVQNNTFIDSSNYAFPITRNGTPTQGSVTPYWPNGYWSNYFNGSTDFLTIPANAAFSFGTGNFTVEAWVYTTNPGNSFGKIIIDVRPDNTNGAYWNFGLTGTGQISFTTMTTGGILVSSPSAIPFNQWVHVAATRSSGTINIWVNGISVTSVTGNVDNISSEVLKIGANAFRGSAGDTYFIGSMSNVRVVKGTAVYTGTFTPPTTLLTAIPNTSLLTCQSNRFKDNSTNNFALTVNGTPQVQAFQPFSPPASYTTAAYGGSGYFGSSQYLVSATSTALQFGTSDFTIEFYAYIISAANTNWIFRTDQGTGYSGIMIYSDGTNFLAYGTTTAGTWDIFNAATIVSIASIRNTWTHFVIVRSASSIKIYVNGTQTNSATTSGSIYQTSNNIEIGNLVSTGTNYISNLRVVKGVAVYTANFTPPTVPVTAIANTSLLLNFTNAGIYDASVQNNAITVGDAQASITQYKWTPTSMRFDGTGDSVTLPANSIFAWGTRDFTVELWANNSAAFTASRNNLAGTMSSGGGLFAPTDTSMNWNSFGVGDIVTVAYVPTIGQWYHLAYSRSSGTGRLFINGVFVASASDSTNYTSTSFTVGGISTQYFNGYIQDLRVTRDVARYTASFSVPTETISTTTNTLLLLKTSATNAQTNSTFLDSSTNNFSLTRNGTPTQGSVTPYWPNGYWGNYFGTSTDYLSPASSATLAFGTNAYTVEFWIYLPSYTVADNRIVDLGSATGAFAVNIGSNGKISIAKSGAVNVFDSNVGFVLRQWNHVAVVRTSTATNGTAIYLNGTNIGTGTDSNNWTVVTTPRINGLAGYSFGWVGYLSNLRVVNGTAVYTGAFAVSATTLAATQSAGTNIAAITGTATALLTCQSNRFIDNSTNSLAITASGTPRVQAFQPFNPTASYTTAAYGGSGYFNGTTDYLSVASNAAFGFGTGDFTFECWAYFTKTSENDAILDFRISGGGGNQIKPTFIFTTGNVLTYFVSSVFRISSNALNIGQWYHVAVVKSSSVTKLYINGTQQGSSYSDSNNYGTTSPCYMGTVGDSPGFSYLGAYISNLRIVKGTAVYTGAFTPPTLAPLTTAGSTSAASYSSTTNVNTSFASSATSLLTNYTNAGIYDAATGSTIITIDNTQASTTQYKWSPTSIKFDGSGDWLTTTVQPIGSGDFTIEFWMYHVNAEAHIFTLGNSWGDTTGVQLIYYSGSNNYCLTVGAGNSNNWGSLIQNAWTHVAIIRNTGTVKLYWNGVPNASSFTSNTTNLTATNLTIGYAQPTANWGSYSGYIQDFRITRAVAPAITLPIAAFLTR